MTPVRLQKYAYASTEPIAGADPTGRYDEAGHYYTTFMVAMATGAYSVTQAYHLAYYSRLPDEVADYDAESQWWNTTGSPLSVTESDQDWARAVFDSLHSLSGSGTGGVMARRRVLKDLVSEGDQPEWQRGFLIHALGDSYAHTRDDGTAFGWPNGHLSALAAPDIVANHIPRYQEFVRNLFAALGGTNGGGNARLSVILNCARTLPQSGDGQVFAMFRLADSFARNEGFTLPYVPSDGLDLTLPVPTRDVVAGLLSKIQSAESELLGRLMPVTPALSLKLDGNLAL